MARILVADDQPQIRAVLHEILAGEGHYVATAADGLAALALLRRLPAPEIALVDLIMPGLGGRAVLRRMRSDPALRGIPVVIMTGSDPGEIDLPPDGSYQGFIGKPFGVAEVLEMIETLLGRAGNGAAPLLNKVV